MQSRLFSHISASFLVVAFVAAISQLELDGLRGAMVDALYRTQWWSSPHREILLVRPGTESSPSFGVGTPRVPASLLVRSLESLKDFEPRAVALVGEVNDSSYTLLELDRIARALSALPSPLVAFTNTDGVGKPIPAPFAGRALYLPGLVSRDAFSYGADSVTRRVMVSINGFPSAYAHIARETRSLGAKEFPNVYSHAGRGDSLYSYIRWHGRAGSYSAIAMQDLWNGKISKEAIRGKILLVGVPPASETTDPIYSPYARNGSKMTMLEGAAQGLATLLNENGLRRTNGPFDIFLSLVLGLVTVNLVLILSPGRGISLVLVEIVLLLVFAWASLFGPGLWINLAHPLLVAAFSYYLVIPYRLLNEYRNRWHYQEKSEMMAQLEQLKSNFLSLVTHDLKTPIARIQGNAELLVTNNGLDEKQKKLAGSILNTTGELSEYVQTILDLARIESSQVPIEKTSKDINAIIDEVLESKRFLANEKNISLTKSLEPLFSFRFDVKLIQRVLANLLENAIKYSPAGTTINLSSKEEGDWIRVSVEDQGYGIATEDQPRVFEKFYRGRGDAASQVKGTGLGLYLVKYFVELHRGAVELKSELGKGSVFTISLPVSHGG